MSIDKIKLNLLNFCDEVTQYANIMLLCYFVNIDNDIEKMRSSYSKDKHTLLGKYWRKAFENYDDEIKKFKNGDKKCEMYNTEMSLGKGRHYPYFRLLYAIICNTKTSLDNAYLGTLNIQLTKAAVATLISEMIITDHGKNVKFSHYSISQFKNAIGQFRSNWTARLNNAVPVSKAPSNPIGDNLYNKFVADMKLHIKLFIDEIWTPSLLIIFYMDFSIYRHSKLSKQANEKFKGLDTDNTKSSKRINFMGTFFGAEDESDVDYYSLKNIMVKQKILGIDPKTEKTTAYNETVSFAISKYISLFIQKSGVVNMLQNFKFNIYNAKEIQVVKENTDTTTTTPLKKDFHDHISDNIKILCNYTNLILMMYLGFAVDQTQQQLIEDNKFKENGNDEELNIEYANNIQTKKKDMIIISNLFRQQTFYKKIKTDITTLFKSNKLKPKNERKTKENLLNDYVKNHAGTYMLSYLENDTTKWDNHLEQLRANHSQYIVNETNLYNWTQCTTSVPLHPDYVKNILDTYIDPKTMQQQQQQQQQIVIPSLLQISLQQQQQKQLYQPLQSQPPPPPPIQTTSSLPPPPQPLSPPQTFDDINFGTLVYDPEFTEKLMNELNQNNQIIDTIPTTPIPSSSSSSYVFASSPPLSPSQQVNINTTNNGDSAPLYMFDDMANNNIENFDIAFSLFDDDNDDDNNEKK